MKKITLFLILISGIILFDACQKVTTDPVLDMSTAVSPAITSPADGASLVLTADNADSTITFEWSAAVYNLTDLAATSYLLQMVQSDSSFDGAKDVASTIETSFTTTYAELNVVLLSLGLTPDVASDLKFRVTATLRSNSDGSVIPETILDSEIIGATITPYETSGPPEYPKLWVPGDYQGWAPDVAPNIYSPEDNNQYTGYIYYPAESASFLFKFTTEASWNGTNYGTGATPGTLDPAGDNLEVPGAGNYYLTADTEGLLWTNELRNFALVGTFNDWGGTPDQELTWDADNQMWTVTMDFAAADEFKWRANSDWAFNYGLNDPDDGFLTQEGANVIIETAGNYTVNLILSEAFPRYELIAN